MSKLKDTIKEEIKQELGDIIYEKAKAEVKHKISSRYRRFKKRVLSFFGYSNTRSQQIEEVEKHLVQSQTPIASDTVLGIIELFTVNYASALTEFTTNVLTSSPQKKPIITEKTEE